MWKKGGLKIPFFQKSGDTFSKADEQVENINDKIKAFIVAGKEMQLWSRGGSVIYHCKKQLFPNVDFKGKSMLEIGCSNGRYCVWASIHGANPVVGLEPLAQGSGSSQNSEYYFNYFIKKLNLKNVQILPKMMQEYNCNENYFDIVLMHSSINHLDEKSCINLKNSPEARRNYSLIFRKLNRIMKKGGKLIIKECSNRNLFADLGFSRHPLYPRINFIKHHEPEYWASLLLSCGFTKSRIFWLFNKRYRHFGIPFRNKAMAYLIGNSFRLEMMCDK